jgi:hypothetical protein
MNREQAASQNTSWADLSLPTRSILALVLSHAMHRFSPTLLRQRGLLSLLDCDYPSMRWPALG